MNFEEALIRTVRAERSASGLTLPELSKAAGIPPRSLDRYLAGDRHMTVAVIYQLASAFGLAGSELLAEAERRMSRADEPTESEREAVRARVAASPARVNPRSRRSGNPPA